MMLKRIRIRMYLFIAWNVLCLFPRLFVLLLVLLLLAHLLFVRLAPFFLSNYPLPLSSSSLSSSTYKNYFGLSNLEKSSANKSLGFNSSIEFANLHRDFSILSGNDPCVSRKNDSLLLVVLIMSRRNANAAMRREGIRQSWAKDAPHGVVIRFVLGKGDVKEEKDKATQIDALLEAEQAKYGDLIRYDVEDTYGNLHLKMSAAFQWQQHFCPNAEFVMKTDDDTIVDLIRWKFWVDNKFRKRATQEANRGAFFGYVLGGTRPIRRVGHKWYVSEKIYPGDLYPDYMQGATYFGTREAMQAVMAHTREVIGFNMDDLLFTGILAERANVTRIHCGLAHFRGEKPVDPVNDLCQLGQPLVFVTFSGIRTPSYGSVEAYKKAYERIHSLKCKQ